MAFSFSEFNTSDEDPSWFRLGSFDVTTAAFATGLFATSLLATAVAGSQFQNSLILVSDAVQNGEVWRIATWPLASDINFFSLLSLFVFYMLGTHLERALGKTDFAKLLGLIIIAPAVLVVAASLITGTTLGLSDFGSLNLAIIVGFAAMAPFARFFFGIPAWGLGAFFLALEILVSVSDRQWGRLVFALAAPAITVGVLLLKGRAHEVVGQTPVAQRVVQRTQQRKQKPLKSVPDIDEGEMDRLLDKISSEGMGALSRDEKKRLKGFSKDMKQD